MSIPGLTVIENHGHGHVRPRPDGFRARCGGPAMCRVCALELAQTKRPEPTIGHVLLALKLTAILDRAKRIAGESITSGAAAVLNAYTGALRAEFEHLLDDMENGE